MFFGPKAASPPKNTSARVDWKVMPLTLRHTPFVEFDADVLFDPGKGILLPDGENHVIAGEEHVAEGARGLDVAGLDIVFQFLEHHAGQPAAFRNEVLGRVIDDDFDVFPLGILEFPLGRLEELARFARHDFHVFRAEPQRAAAAVHGGIADADDQYPLADFIDVAECNGLQPSDADMNAIGVVTTGQFEFFALGRARTDEHGIEFLGVEQPLQLLIGEFRRRSAPMFTM